MLKEFLRELEPELFEAEQVELWVQEAWAAYARKIEAQRIKLAG